MEQYLYNKLDRFIEGTVDTERELAEVFTIIHYFEDEDFSNEFTNEEAPKFLLRSAAKVYGKITEIRKLGLDS